VGGRSRSSDSGSGVSHESAVRAPATLPSPDGEPLTFKVRCWTSRSSKAPVRRHPITIAPDWSLDTPHDLASERIASAFGGYLSCTDLDATIPAAQRWIELQQRQGEAPIVFLGRPTRWQVRRRQQCCTQKGYESATKAAEHVRDPRHLATQFGAPRRQLTDVIKAIEKAWSGTGAFTLDGPDAAAAAEVCSRGALDVTELWYAGMHPSRILDIHSAIGATGRLPGRFYLGVLVKGTKLDWLSDTLRTAGIDADEVEEVLEVAGVRVDGPQEEAAEWLAWTRGATDVIDPSRRGRWMAMGVSRRMIMLLDQYLIAPDDIATLSRGVGRDPDGAARQLAAWLEAGLRPPVDDLVRLHQEGIGPHWYVPSRAAVNRLRAQLGLSEMRASDTDLAFLLAVAGTVPDAVARFRAGTPLW
jgi:hypothetical protein